MLSGRIKRPDPLERTTLPIAGYLKIGEREESNGRTIPRSTDYFRATGSYASYFHDAYGEKPNKIQIVFISDKYGESCYEEYEARDKDGKKAGYGDGESWYVWDQAKKDYIQVTTEKKDTLTVEMNLKWSVTLTLTFIIPSIKGLFALWRFHTKGVASSVPDIMKTFDSVLQQAGTVRFLPFELIVKKVKSQKPGTMFLFPVVSLIPNLSQQNILQVKELINSGYDLNSIGLLSDNGMQSLMGKPALKECTVEDKIESCESLDELIELSNNYPKMGDVLKLKFRNKYEKLSETDIS